MTIIISQKIDFRDRRRKNKSPLSGQQENHPRKTRPVRQHRTGLRVLNRTNSTI